MNQREIKFRGKRIDNGEWLYGWLFKDALHGKLAIQQTTSSIGGDRGHMAIHTVSKEVIPESVGQLVGPKYKSGEEIYEGDIVKRMAKKMKLNPTEADFDNKTMYDYHLEISFMEYRDNGFWIHDEDFGYEGEDLWDWDQMEKIGNMYENPELLPKAKS